VRGANAGLLPNLTVAENTTPGVLTSLDSDGFTLGSNGELNANNASYVSWNFKAGGAAVTNTDGTITSQVSANTEAGFSVVSYTGNGVSGATVGHGLSDSPSMIIIKNTVENSATGSGTNWRVYHKDLTAGYNIMLSQTNAQSATPAAFTTTPPSSTVFTLGNFVGTNATVSGGAAEYIAYCFAEVEGFSSIGSYVGTGASGNSIVTGFEPAFVLIKRTDDVGAWSLYDNKRNPENPKDKKLVPNSSAAENVAGVTYQLNFYENGFDFNGGGVDLNGSGGKYIYMAFAADPTTVDPSLEDSFNTVLYTGNRPSTQSITGVGFQPDLVWIKDRVNGAYPHVLTDSVRGNTKYLQSNSSGAELTTTSGITSFDSDGFSLGADGYFNGGPSGAFDPMVAWCWKGAELPAINSNGSVPSVVSANPAAGFSIVSYTNATSGTTDQRYTIGHGLDSAPDLIITKVRNVDGYRWTTYNSFNGTQQYMALNQTIASTSYPKAFPVIPSSTVFTLDEAWPHRANDSAMAYCFHSVAGFSKFGTYTGTGSARTISLDFTPAFVMIKRTGTTGSWQIFDNKRSTYRLIPNDPTQELQTAGTNDEVTLVANGFTLPTDGGNGNNSALAGNTYIYMAFANQF